MGRVLDLSSDGLESGRGTQYHTIPFTTIKFPGGEEHIRIEQFGEDRSEPILIVFKPINSRDIFILMLAVDALEGMGYEDLSLYMPYIPYARQDRVAVEGEPLSIRVFTELINRLRFNTVYSLDPHSDVCVALLNNLVVIEHNSIVKSIIDKLFGQDFFRIVSPDLGAAKKIDKMIREIGHTQPPVLAIKHRDVVTGEISHTEVIGPDLLGFSALVVDDICDGGRTFIELAKVLRQKDVGSLHLYVTHGIFSKGLVPLLSYYDTIWVTDSVLHTEAEIEKLSEDLQDRVTVLQQRLTHLTDSDNESDEHIHEEDDE